MTRLTHAAIIAILAFVGTITTRAQDSTIVVIDHAAGVFVDAYRSHDGRHEAIAARNISGIGTSSLTVRTSEPVKVVLRNYVTALWDARATTKEFESPDYALYEGLLEELKPYAADVPLLLGIVTADREGVPERATLKVTAFRDSVMALRATTMWKVRGLSLQDALTPEEIADTRRFAAAYLGGSSARPRLRLLDSLAVWYDSLGHARMTKEVSDLREQSKVLLTKATQLERALIRLSSIGTSAEVPLTVRSTWMKGVSATVTIVSSETMSFAGLDTTLTRYSITLLPDPLVRPMSALTVMYWSGTDFATYATGRQTGGYVIRSSKDDISHFSQGLSFGLSWRFLDFRDVKDKGIALSVPELIVNPFDKFRAIGLGVGVSYTFLKLSVGALWIRNTVLDGRSVGEMIDDPAALRTMSAYTPRFFVGLGIYNVSF